jgi:hypothetical protein
MGPYSARRCDDAHLQSQARFCGRPEELLAYRVGEPVIASRLLRAEGGGVAEALDGPKAPFRPGRHLEAVLAAP